MPLGLASFCEVHSHHEDSQRLTKDAYPKSMPTYLTPGVYYETVDVSRNSINAIRTDIAAFVGIAERGVLHTPVRVTSWEQFQTAFGNFIPNGYLAYSAKGFFENGGQTCYIVRVAATQSTESDPAVLQPADRLSSIVLSVENFIPGKIVRLRQGSLEPRDHLLQAMDAATRRLTWEQPLEAEFILNNPGLPLQFETGALAASGVLLDSNGQPTLRIEALSPGSWGNWLTVRLARSSSAATRTRIVPPQPSDFASSIVESMAGFPAGSLVKILQENTPAPIESYRVVKGVDPLRNQLFWDAPIDPVYDLTKPLFFETLEFALTVYVDGHPREHFSNLSLVNRSGMDDGPEVKNRYVEFIINGPETDDPEAKQRFTASQFIRVKNLNSPSPLPYNLPALGAVNLKRNLLPLQSGQDGVTALRPEDFTGDAGAAIKKGLRALEDVDEVSIVAVPDILIQPTPPIEIAPLPPQPVNICLPLLEDEPVADAAMPRTYEQAPSFSLDEVLFVQGALVAHCEMLRDRFALLDPPVTTRQWLVSDQPPLVAQETSVMELNDILRWRQCFDSKYAALYYPWVVVYDPLHLGNQNVRAIPPSGHVAGIFARTDLETGVHKAPANRELEWAQGTNAEVTPEIQGALNPAGINAIVVFPGRGVRLYAARTVSSDPSWRYVNVRRLLMMIEEAVEDAIQWAVFEPNDFYLRQMLVMSISGFLRTLWERGSFVGATADEAFFVKCDDENNPPTMADLGRIIVDVGVAPVIPAEFVIFRIGKTVDELEIRE
jgi:uncharacterized protein